MSDQKAFSDFLDRLGNDDAFRAQLQKDPTQALGGLGIKVPAGLHTGDVKLPSKADVQAKKSALLSHAETAPHAMMVFFCLK